MKLLQGLFIEHPSKVFPNPKDNPTLEDRAILNAKPKVPARKVMVLG